MKASNLFGVGLSASLLAAAAGQVAFTPGNLVVSQIYNGTDTVAAGTASPMFLVELNISTGAVVQTIPIPTTPNGANHALTVRGSSTSMGHLGRSVDKRFVTLMGFDAPLGTLQVSQTSAATNPRVVALINFNGVVDTTTALTDAYDASTGSNEDPRHAATTDGNDIWTSGVGFVPGFGGISGGVRYTTHGSTTSVQLASSPTNTRCTRIFNGQLYVTSASSSFQGVSTVGTGLPTTTGQAIIGLPGFPTVAGPSNYDFFFADANTVYVADDRTINPTPPATPGGIQKWTFDAGTSSWSLAYTITSGLTSLGCRGLIGKVDRNGTTLWATTADNIPLVVKVLDTGAASAFTTFATSPAAAGGTQPLYRGIDFVPEGTVVPPSCYANCDHSTTTPCLNVLDFSCFLNAFAAGQTYANCDNSTTPPVLNVLDFSCFLNTFAAGCSAC